VRRAVSRIAGTTALALALAAAPSACSSVLGIADYSDREADSGAPSADGTPPGEGGSRGDGGGPSEGGPEAEGGASTVSGTVYDRTLTPVAGAKVRIGKAPPVVTGADGTFTFANVPPTYDLDVVGPLKDIANYRGVTARTPQVGVGAPGRAAPIAYTLSASLGANDKVQAFFVSGRSDQGSSATAAAGTVAASWTGGPTATGVLGMWIVTVDPVSNQLTDIKATTLSPMSLTESTSTTYPFGNASPNTAGAITGTFAYPWAGTVALMSATAHYPALAPAGHGYLVQGPSSQTAFAIPTPTMSGATVDVCFAFNVTEAPTGTVYTCFPKLAPNTAGLSVSFPYTRVHAISPLPLANDVTTQTSFTWSNAPGTFDVFFYCGPDGYTQSVFTTALTTKIPDMTELGVPLPAKGTCSWEVTSYPTHPGPDDFLGDLPTKIAIASSSSSRDSRTFTSK
jgi:hypothetical protein